MAPDPKPLIERRPAAPDLVTLTEVCRRLELSAKTVKLLHRERGLPLIRLTEGATIYAFWSEIEAWMRKAVKS
jgi:hypothetical protein